MICGHGDLTLVNGSATVTVPRMPANAKVILTAKSLLGTIGTLRYSIQAGTGFTVTSLSPLDQSVVSWVVIV